MTWNTVPPARPGWKWIRLPTGVYVEVREETP
jgi:hypothetical protein